MHTPTPDTRHTPPYRFNFFRSAPLPEDFDRAARDTLRSVQAALSQNADKVEWVTFVPIAAEVLAKAKAEHPLPDKSKLFWRQVLRVPLIMASAWLMMQALALLSGDDAPRFEWQTGPVGTLILVLVLIGVFQFGAALHYELKKRMHSTHNVYRLRLNQRKQRIEVLNFLGKQVRETQKYHRGSELPAFALPRDDDGSYRALRERVQAEITRLTGAHFREGEDTVSDVHLR